MIGIVELFSFRQMRDVAGVYHEGFAGSVLILPIACWSVPIELGLAGLLKPTWLSLICRKVNFERLIARCWNA